MKGYLANSADQIRRCRMWRLIRFSTVCKYFSHFVLGICKFHNWTPKIEIGLFQYIVWASLFSIQWVKVMHPSCLTRHKMWEDATNNKHSATNLVNTFIHVSNVNLYHSVSKFSSRQYFFSYVTHKIGFEISCKLSTK